jgi:hypothetical protein
MADEALVALIGEAEEHAGRDFSSYPALRPEDTSADEATKHPSAGSDVRGTFESAAVPDLGALIHDDSSVPHVENNARFYCSTQAYEVGWISQDQASFWNRVTRGRQKVGAVIGQEMVERGEEIEGPSKAEPVNFERGSFLVGTTPPLAVGYHPADRFVSVNETAYAWPWCNRYAGGRKPARPHDCRAV